MKIILIITAFIVGSYNLIAQKETFNVKELQFFDTQNNQWKEFSNQENYFKKITIDENKIVFYTYFDVNFVVHKHNMEKVFIDPKEVAGNEAYELKFQIGGNPHTLYMGNFNRRTLNRVIPLKLTIPIKGYFEGHPNSIVYIRMVFIEDYKVEYLYE